MSSFLPDLLVRAGFSSTHIIVHGVRLSKFAIIVNKLTRYESLNPSSIDFDSITISAGKDIPWEALVLEYNTQVYMFPEHQLSYFSI